MLDEFWESPIAGLLRPLRRSMPACLAVCIVLFFFPAVWFVSLKLYLLGVFAGLALILFLSTEGRTFNISAAHDAAAPTLLLRTAAMLRGAGFSVSTQSETTLTARRGSDFSLKTFLSGSIWSILVEPEWPVLPIALSVTVKPSERGSLLEVRSRFLLPAFVGSSGERIKALLAKTTTAVAGLDPAALAAADGSVVISDDLGMRMGTLGLGIWLAIVAMSVLSMGAVIWHGHAWMWEAAAIVNADELKERAQDMRYGLTAKVDWALNAEAAGIRRMKELSGLSEVMRTLPPTVESFPLFVGTVGESGLVQFKLRPEVAARPPAGIHVSRGAGGAMIQGLSGGIFYGQSVILSSSAARSLGAKSVVLGTVLTFSDIERLAPVILPIQVIGKGAPTRTWWWLREFEAFTAAPGTADSGQRQSLPAELQIWEDGKPVVRLDWYYDQGRCRVRASKGEGSLPDAVAAAVEARARQAAPSTSRLMSLLSGIFTPKGDGSAGVVREESRGDKPWLAAYFVDRGRGPSGYKGFSFAAANSPHRLEWALFSFERTLLIVPSLVVLVVMIFGLFLSLRITRPIFEIKDALKSIVEGNFSVRLKTKHKGELGRLAAVVNKAAEGLEMREAIIALLGKYMTRQAAEGVLRKDAASAPAGDHREVSVLFADLRAFAGLSERRPAAAVVESLEEYFAVMALVLASNGGVLDKCGGDGLMAIFNAPRDQPDHARRAILAALEMQEAFQSLNLKRVRRGEEPIAIGIGVDTGMALLGMTGSVERMEIPAIGDAANLASRLVRYPLRGQVVIGPGAFEKVKGSIEYEALGKVAVEGKAEPVEAWLVLDFKPR